MAEASTGMDTDDLEPRPKPSDRQNRDLDPMSIEELEDYIAALRAEIARAEQNIAAKKKHRDGIEGLFKR